MAGKSMEKEKIIQIGVRVRDLEATAEKWKAFLGKEPYIGITEGYEVTGATYHGKPCRGMVKQALFDLDNVQIELIAPWDDDLNAWSEGMDEVGEGLHHLAIKTNDIEGAVAEMEKQGFKVMQRGDWAGDSPGTYVYMDARDDLKTIIELLAF